MSQEGKEDSEEAGDGQISKDVLDISIPGARVARKKFYLSAKAEGRKRKKTCP